MLVIANRKLHFPPRSPESSCGPGRERPGSGVPNLCFLEMEQELKAVRPETPKSRFTGLGLTTYVLGCASLARALVLFDVVGFFDV